MTLCLTFDDGLKDHFEIVAPLLESYGWRGSFNLPTSFMHPACEKPDARAFEDLCLVGNEGNLMSWDDARDLVRRGHRVYPHTANHVNLRNVMDSGDEAFVDQQIIAAKERFVEMMGYAPKFFCLPHNAMNERVGLLLEKAGMKPFNCYREDFGGGVGFMSSKSATEYLTECRNQGWWHVDIMIHGVEASHGGWRPFADRQSFDRFLDEIKLLEEKNVIKVVDYEKAHADELSSNRLCLLGLRVLKRLNWSMMRRKYHA